MGIDCAVNLWVGQGTVYLIFSERCFVLAYDKFMWIICSRGFGVFFSGRTKIFVVTPAGDSLLVMVLAVWIECVLNAFSSLLFFSIIVTTFVCSKERCIRWLCLPWGFRCFVEVRSLFENYSSLVEWLVDLFQELFCVFCVESTLRHSKSCVDIPRGLYIASWTDIVYEQCDFSERVRRLSHCDVDGV